MKFKCINSSSNEKWEGAIRTLINYGSHFEMRIESRSGIMVIFGKTSRGLFASMPDFEVSCHLVDLKNHFWNTERLIKVLGEADGITVSAALYALANKIEI